MTAQTAVPRRPRVALVVALTAALALLCCGGGTVAFFFDGVKHNPNVQAFTSCGSTTLVDFKGKLPRVTQLGDEQVRNAAIIVAVGQQMQVPPKGWVIAIATALQESWLTNLGNLGAHNDHDSLGLFQQRPSQGWGTPAQIMDPQYASHKFYEKLSTIQGWQTMALTDAAQAVQNSAFPDAYAKHEPLASLVVNVLTNGAGRAVGALTDLRCALPGEISASGWTVPVRGPIVSGFRTPQRPSHNGIDLAVPKNTVVHAAASGIVTTARCDVVATIICDHDGGLGVPGCGWYVDILHAGKVITRYCHLIARPDVTPGQSVAVGQAIGHSGTSGHSTGPHLHFEIHLNGDFSHDGAVNPAPFMEQAGAPLGEPKA
jgi:murein DD-endopeptidase MepM/ murein hydrolase activator NlpD